MFFIIGEEYLWDEEKLLACNRSEISEANQRQLGYKLPDEKTLSTHHYRFLNASLFEELLSQNTDNPTLVFKKFLSSDIPMLTAEIEHHLTSAPAQLESVVTWCNCPSLSNAARKLGIPVTHLELGPLRAPIYKPTGYVDFGGVNSNTEAEHRYKQYEQNLTLDIKTRDILDFFQKLPVTLSDTENYECGIALQVEDDSNLVAFGNGFDNKSLIARTQIKNQNQKILVRPHPGSQFTLKGHQFEIDSSENSLAFISRCKKIYTINSSIGLEAILQEKPVEILGDCSFFFINESESLAERNKRLAFYLLFYLVPFDLLFDIEYLRLRFRSRNELEILETHIDFYLSRTENSQSKISKSPGERIAEMLYQNEIENMKNKIEDLKKQIGDLTRKINDLQNITDEKNIKISEITAESAHKNTIIQSHEDLIKTRETEIEKIVGELSAARRDMELANNAAIEHNAETIKQAEHARNIELQLAEMAQLQQEYKNSIQQLKGSATLNELTYKNRFSELKNELLAKDHRLTELQAAINARNIEIDKANADASKEISIRDFHLRNFQAVLDQRDAAIEALNINLENTKSALKFITSSKSWRVTSPLRAARRYTITIPNRLVRAAASKSARTLYKKIPLSQTQKQEIKNSIFLNMPLFFRKTRAYKDWELFNERRSYESELATPSHSSIVFGAKHNKIAILATRHTLYVAHLIDNFLRSIGYKCTIETEYTPEDDQAQLHIVICAQMFPHLPQNFIAFQMEQSVHSRWFTPEYFSILEKASSIFEYSTKNIEYLLQNGIPYQKIFFLPIRPLPEYSNYLLKHNYNLNHKNRNIDVLFYGDPNCDRRKKFLTKLEENFDVKIASEVFGEQLVSLIKASKVVVNVHYYEGALLETTRICETLSIGTPIVSEESVDFSEHQDLKEVVKFSPIGDIDAMVQQVHHLLNNKSAYNRQKSLINKFCRDDKKFSDYFRRYLLANDAISFNEFRKTADFLPKPKGPIPKLCLTLSETATRKKAFLEKPTHEFEVVEGIRHRIGWRGCGMSYKYILSSLQKYDAKFSIICEDDVEFPPDFDEKLEKILGYLNTLGKSWHLFSGFIAHLHPDTEILKVEKVGDIEYIHINKMTSMVMNIYSRKTIEVIKHWDETNSDAETNTIDRHIESYPNLDVITTLPFLVGHAEDRTSTLWGFKNTQYNEIINESASLLASKVAEFKAKQRPE